MIKGKVTSTTGEPSPHDFIIEGEDGKEYFAHLGDISDNEQLLYSNPQHKTTYLQVGDVVEFDVPQDLNKRAIRIKKV